MRETRFLEWMRARNMLIRVVKLLRNMQTLSMPEKACLFTKFAKNARPLEGAVQAVAVLEKF